MKAMHSSIRLVTLSNSYFVCRSLAVVTSRTAAQKRQLSHNNVLRVASDISHWRSTAQSETDDATASSCCSDTVEAQQ